LSVRASFLGSSRDTRANLQIHVQRSCCQLEEKDEFEREECDSSFDSAGKLNDHIKLVHTWKPKACTELGCDLKVVYQTKSKYQTHMKIHAKFKPSKCLFPSWTHPTVYTTSGTFRKHLRNAHNITDRADLDKRMPDYKPKHVPHKCRAAGCESKQTWTQPGNLKEHLRDKHDYSEAENDAYFA